MVLRAGRRGALSHATAIDLYDLADVDPETIHSTVPFGYRTRRQHGDVYRVHHQNLAASGVRRFEEDPDCDTRYPIA